MELDVFEEIGEMLKIKKIRNNILREKMIIRIWF
jgi:hypothetical protein